VKILLVVSFGTVVAVVTAVCFLAVVAGAVMGDRQAVVAGLTLWGIMALAVLANWGLWRAVVWAAGGRRRVKGGRG